MDNVHEGHRKRLKKQFLENGITSMSEHQIIELLLFYALPRCDTNVIAHELIDRFGSVTGVLNAGKDELLGIKGITENAVALFRLIPSLFGIYSIDEIKNKPLDDLSVITDYFVGCFIGIRTEQLKVCCLDDNLRVVCCTTIEDGCVNSVPVNVRKIVETVYNAKCSMIILAHNHPKGIAIPSDEDIKSTRQLKQILSSVGINLLDHVIVGQNSAVSMKYSGYFNTFD